MFPQRLKSTTPYVKDSRYTGLLLVKMHFTPVLALAGLAAAAPYNLNTTAPAELDARTVNLTTFPSGLKYRSTNLTAPPADLHVRSANLTAPAGLKFRRSAYTNSTRRATGSAENVDISNFSVEQKLAGNTANVESIAAVSFDIQGNITCSADSPGTSGTVFLCGSSPYRFGLVNGTSSQYALRVYHDFGGAYVYPTTFCSE